MTREEEIIARAEEAEKETTFSDIVLKAKGVCSAYGIGFLEGAVWADKTMIDKACEWLARNDSYSKPTDRLIIDFRKAMEEQNYGDARLHD